MQVTETTNEGLKRELKVVVGAGMLEERLMNRLAELKTQVRVKGFRPGKVPVAYLRKIHGRSVMAEIVQQTVNETSQRALEERKERPAMPPEISFSEDEKEIDDLMTGKGDLAYSMTFEIVPDIEVMDFSKLKLERQLADVSDEDVEERIKGFAAQQRDFEPRKEGAKAKSGDRVKIDFIGRVDGEAFEGGTANDAPLELGSNSYLPGFEDQLIGAAAGDEVTVKVHFPDDYAATHLAGKDAEFAVTVKEVAAPKEVVINDDFAKGLGLDSLATMREAIREQLVSEHQQISDSKLKRQVLDALDEGHKIDLPSRLVDQEFDLIWEQVTKEMEQSAETFADEGTDEEEARKEYRTIAERRVGLGLILGEVGSANSVEVTEEEVNQALAERVRQFPGQEQQVYDFYQKNPGALNELRGPIFEQKVIDLIIAQADVSEKKVSKDELLRDPDDEAAADDKAKKTKSAKKKKAAKKPAGKTAVAKKPAAKKKSS